MRTLFAAALLTLSFAAPALAQTDWIVTKTEWSQDDERRFGEFVKALATSKCTNVNECIRSSANPYRDSDPADFKFWSDCADFPYFLRAYFAWKNQLPFSYLSAVGTWDQPKIDYTIQNVPVRDWWGRVYYRQEYVQKTKYPDTRYSESGNYPTERRRIAPSADGSRVSFTSSTNNMQDTVDTGFFRFSPEMGDDVATDFYPIDITPRAVRPGAVAYSPMGHVAIVYDVTPEGRILLFNAHPADKSKPGSATPVSRTTFETRKEYVRSRPAHGSGLKQWRPFKLVGATEKNGRLIGGRFVFKKNAELADYSTVQFYGTGRSGGDATFEIRGRTVSYETFIRQRLASAKLDLVADLQRRLAEACDLFKGRVKSVQDAIDAGLHLKAHPSTLPQNIFSANGEWEDYSSPSKDLRLRFAFVSMRLDLQEAIQAIRNGDASVIRPENLRSELLQAYKNVASTCSVTYKNSVGQPVGLGFSQLIGRTLTMSFDPYHCPERRWGATDASELATCRDDRDKTAWYQAEQAIRYYLEKDWKAEGPISFTDLRDGNLPFEIPSKPNIDIKSYLEQLPENL